jgi:hypothetical protein
LRVRRAEFDGDQAVSAWRFRKNATERRLWKVNRTTILNDERMAIPGGTTEDFDFYTRFAGAKHYRDAAGLQRLQGFTSALPRVVSVVKQGSV